MARRTIDDLDPTEFENLTFDVLQSTGLRNLVWRTPGADGGRDIEGLYLINDLSGSLTAQNWYVECKRYSVAIDWPTVWKKIAYADSLKADYLLLVTNSNPSPGCETHISQWNADRRKVQIRVWRGYQINKILLNYPAVSAKYGLVGDGIASEISLLPLLLDIMKVAQATYTSFEFGSDPSSGLVVNAALTELVSLRMDQLRTAGQLMPSERCTIAPDYQWLTWEGPVAYWEVSGIRAVLSSYRYALGAARLKVVSNGAEADILPMDSRGRLTPSVRASISNVALWANIELVAIDDVSLKMTIRSR